MYSSVCTALLEQSRVIGEQNKNKMGKAKYSDVIESKGEYL